MKKKWHLLAMALLLAGCAFLITPHPGAAESTEKIVYRQKWLLNTSVVGDLYAQTNGLFRDAGLSVTIKAGGPERDAIKELELGYAQFGIASADQVIRALAKGAPVVVIAQIFQKNPLQWIYHEDTPAISRLTDLKGKTIGITFGGNDETIMRALLSSAGIRERDVRFFSVRYDYTPFFKRQVHIWPVYRNSQAVFLAHKLKQAGKGLRLLDPARFGVRFVANSLVTARRTLTTRPGTVRRFATALVAGWRQALLPANREKALNTIRQYDRDTAMEILTDQLWETRQLVQPDPKTPIGAIDVAAWRQTEQIMRDQNLISRPVHVEKALHPFGGKYGQP